MSPVSPGIEFLDVGTVLILRPIITEDGKVLLNVVLKDSGGKIVQNGFLEGETTEVQATILMLHGDGVIIGRLIHEENVQARSIVPYFGRKPILGRFRLFGRPSSEIREAN